MRRAKNDVPVRIDLLGSTARQIKNFVMPLVMAKWMENIFETAGKSFFLER